MPPVSTEASGICHYAAESGCCVVQCLSGNGMVNDGANYWLVRSLLLSTTAWCVSVPNSQRGRMAFGVVDG